MSARSDGGPELAERPGGVCCHLYLLGPRLRCRFVARAQLRRRILGAPHHEGIASPIHNNVRVDIVEVARVWSSLCEDAGLSPATTAPTPSRHQARLVPPGEGGLLKQVTEAVLKRPLAEELTEHLGYKVRDPTGHGTANNTSNGYTSNRLIAKAARSIWTYLGPTSLLVQEAGSALPADRGGLNRLMNRTRGRG